MSQNVATCPRCERLTPAARGECIYCSEPLPFATIDSAPAQRNIDPGDHAFNTILEPLSAQPNESVIVALAKSLQLEVSEIQTLINAGKPLPLARSQTRAEAEMIAALVRTCGARAVVIADEQLGLNRELVRARRIEITDEGFLIRHSGGETTVDKADIKLLVLGELRNSRVDYTEGLKGRRSQSGNVLDSFEFRAEEMFLDVYTATLDKSFRIKADAFDYSGLVSPLSVRADMNFKTAVEALRANSPRAILDIDFSKLRNILNRPWPERTRNESHGIKRTMPFRSVSKASVTSDNRDQFNRYSRLMFLMLGSPGFSAGSGNSFGE